MITGGSGSRKTNALLNIISHKPDIDKVCLYAKDPFEAKYQLLTRLLDLKHHNGSKVFIEYPNDMDYFYENIKEENPNKEHKILIVFDNNMADMLINKKGSTRSNRIIYLRFKTKHFLCFIRQSYFAVPKPIRLIYTNYFILDITNKRELQQLIIHQILTLNIYESVPKIMCKIVFFFSERYYSCIK